jgi:hypothetical protein
VFYLRDGYVIHRCSISFFLSVMLLTFLVCWSLSFVLDVLAVSCSASVFI